MNKDDDDDVGLLQSYERIGFQINEHLYMILIIMTYMEASVNYVTNFLWQRFNAKKVSVSISGSIPKLPFYLRENSMSEQFDDLLVDSDDSI